MAPALSQGEAHRPARIVESGSGIDQDWDPVDPEPHCERVGMAMRGQGQISERAVIDHEVEAAPGGSLVNDRIAPITEQAHAVGCVAEAGGHGEQGIAQVRIASRREEVGPAGQAGDRRNHRGDVARFSVRGLGDDTALVVVPDRGDVPVEIHQRAQEPGRRDEAVDHRRCEGTSLCHADQACEGDHLAGEGLIARRLLGAGSVGQDLRESLPFEHGAAGGLPSLVEIGNEDAGEEQAEPLGDAVIVRRRMQGGEGRDLPGMGGDEPPDHDPVLSIEPVPTEGRHEQRDGDEAHCEFDARAPMDAAMRRVGVREVAQDRQGEAPGRQISPGRKGGQRMQNLEPRRLPDELDVAGERACRIVPATSQVDAKEPGLGSGPVPSGDGIAAPEPRRAGRRPGDHGPVAPEETQIAMARALGARDNFFARRDVGARRCEAVPETRDFVNVPV